MLVQSAHDHGLSIAQKNSAELLNKAKEIGTDFAIAEECNRSDGQLLFFESVEIRFMFSSSQGITNAETTKRFMETRCWLSNIEGRISRKVAGIIRNFRRSFEKSTWRPRTARDTCLTHVDVSARGIVSDLCKRGLRTRDKFCKY